MATLDKAGIDPDADRVVRKLAKAGHKAYLVGGCVRDLLLARKPKDFDVATSATPNEIKATFRNCRIIGRRFRLAHVFFGSKIIETSTFRANPRDEDNDDLLIRRDNVFGTETEDARRRDFTINGLFYDVERDEVIDHVSGLVDLDAKLIRTIGDPDIRFQEDPVRILRAIKFAARLDFGFEPDTWRALLRWRGEISKCAPPRLLEEIHRLLRGGAARRSFELLVETGVLEVLSPYLAGLLEGPGAAAVAPPLAHSVPRPTVARVEYDDEDPAEHDPDDPDEPAAKLAATDVEEDLDDEELGWHRLWADDAPAPRPSAPTPVKLSFVGNDVAARRERVWATLPQIDHAIAAGLELSNAVAFGVLLAPYLFGPNGEDRGGDLNSAVNELAGPMIVQLHVTRRDSERLRSLLLGLRRLYAAKKKGVQAELAGGREVVEDATQLFALLERAAGREPAPVAAIASDEGREGEADDEGGDGPRKRRRRRRGGHRR
ncbi:MAG TPA: polynucleotide adenylyltransferase PcnB [Kofleriaceae bacterium]|jgi:poly(A) polymerase